MQENESTLFNAGGDPQWKDEQLWWGIAVMAEVWAYVLLPPLKNKTKVWLCIFSNDFYIDTVVSPKFLPSVDAAHDQAKLPEPRRHS